LYEIWEDNFQLLFRWREAFLENIIDPVIEIDLYVEEGKLFFRSFFVLLVLVFKVSVGDAGHISVLILLHEKVDGMDTYPPLLD
jgi:hypothetical protein